MSIYAKKSRGEKTTDAKIILLVFKSKVYKIDVNNLERVPIELIYLSNVGNNYLVTKTIHDNFITKLNILDLQKQNVEKKMDKNIHDIHTFVVG